MSFGEDFGFDQEPRKMFVSFLIWNINQVEQRLYLFPNTVKAIYALEGLISSLDAKSQKTLEPQLKQLESFHTNFNLCSRTKLKQIYQEVLRYLHRTYLSEVTRGIIPASTLPPTTPKPKAKQYKKTLPDDVI